MANTKRLDLRAERINRGLTTTDLAAILGVARLTVTRIERGGKLVKAPTMLKIAAWLETTPAELWPADGDDQAVA